MGITLWPPIEWTFKANGGFRPKALPKKGPAPISSFLLGRIESLTGAQPPALKTLELEGDKHVAFDVDGLPACGWADLRAADTAEVRKACGGALIGSGETQLLLAYPENSPISVRSELLLVNGGFRAAVTTLFLYAHIGIPTATAIVAPVKVKKVDHGRYGLLATVSIPKLAEGYGQVESFFLRIEKGVLAATCADDRLQAGIALDFADSTALSATLVQFCNPKG
jgi:hypothetical protein